MWKIDVKSIVGPGAIDPAQIANEADIIDKIAGEVSSGKYRNANQVADAIKHAGMTPAMQE